MTGLQTVSYGGGVQSTALLVLAARKVIDFPIFLMANVGDDSEHPATLAYVRDVAMPYAAEHGLQMHLIDHTKRDGTVETLMGRMQDQMARRRPVDIPIRGMNGAPGYRQCTRDFKRRVIARWLREQGATSKNPATVAIGISVDEIQRANTKQAEGNQAVVYPLLDLGLNRGDCKRLIAEAGLPVPGKSSCYFCPFHSAAVWEDMARDEPELFEKSAALEESINANRQVGSQYAEPVFLTRFGIPLRAAISAGQDLLPMVDDDGCDSGWCMT